MSLEETLEELQGRRDRALRQGGAERVRRQHDRGRLTARERLDKLLDPGSFMEFGLLCTSDMPGMADKTPADALILGYGSVNGRRVGIIANDFTVLASTNARVNVKKMLQFKVQVKKYGIPLIWLGEAGGARLPDCQGSDKMLSIGGGGADALWPEYVHFRQYPFVFAAMGDCHGLVDFQACVADFVVQVKGSTMSVSGPRALSRAVGESHSSEDMGGWKLHAEVTGVTDQVAENEEDCFNIIKGFLEYMPSNHNELPPNRPGPEGSEARMAKILDFFPEDRTRAYDMHKIIECIVDEGKYLELKPSFGKMLVTCLARVSGHVVGIVANNPLINAGAMNTDALEKHTSFLCFCDSFNIPLVFLCDTPGHHTGKEAESKGVGAKVVSNLQALLQVTVPKIHVIIRKSYGQGAVNMCGPGLGPDFFVAWPTAEIGFLDPLIAADVVYGSLPEGGKQKMVDKMIADTSPFPAAQSYCLQDIISPYDTRDYLIKVLGIVRDSKDQGMSKHLLSNWPTKF